MRKIRYQILSVRARSGMMAIVVRCQLFGRHIDIDTDVRVYPEQWDNKDGLVIGNPNSLKLNQCIRRTLYELESLELASTEQLSLIQLKKIWENRDSVEDFSTLSQYSDVTESIRESTLQNHLFFFKLIREFSPSCPVNVLDEDFVRRFFSYLKGRKYKESTIFKYMTIFSDTIISRESCSETRYRHIHSTFITGKGLQPIAARH